ncbi:protein BREAST CANCER SUSCEPTIBILITY 2 homolog B-like isoform X1 [Amaranthus tricolor]|uniref:protein BREAST CANCER SUSCEPTIBILITY 2 homolog B-like isoform X1 n=1 Tax=Amaranthus tricolor TaxID=29722 RepID=UPI002586B6EF|nr:protein BREAST CANCER SUSCEPTIBILITY 2 homolog B-like isoform X1 [Amaranthus tricolor]
MNNSLQRRRMVSTWQLFSNAGDDLRWKISPSPAPSHHLNQLHCSPPPNFPSFHDVLLQGSSKILGDCEEHNAEVFETPMVRTGQGSTVVLKKSSIAKASSVLGDDVFADFDTGKPSCKGKDFSSPNSMFQTGSGKRLNISPAGLLRAKTLLGVHEINNDCSFQSIQPPKKKLCRVRTASLEKGTEINTFCSKLPFNLKNNSSEIDSVDKDIGKLIRPVFSGGTTKPTSIKFQTAGGRFISVSKDALQQARNLLGDPEMDSLPNESGDDAFMFSFISHSNTDGSAFTKDNNNDSSHQRKQNSKIFVSPMKPSSHKKQEVKSDSLLSGTNLMRKFDAEAIINNSNDKPSISYLTNTMQGKLDVFDATPQKSLSNGPGPCSHFSKSSKPSGLPLAEITNTATSDSITKKGTKVLKRHGRSYVSPFKRPRSSKFITSMNYSKFSVPNELSGMEHEAPCPRNKVSTRFPFRHSRLYVKEYFKEPPIHTKELEHLPAQVRQLNPQNSERYSFCDGSQIVGVENFYHMLVQSEASMQYASKEWVANHYKWIVWKLASYERCYSAKVLKKFLTVLNVLEELKYRYEREVNHGQCSAIKRILEGDALPSSTLVLCVSEVQSALPSLEGKTSISTLELTDGWYSICAQLDHLLSKQLAGGKIFVGQKLRICGAGLNGWDGPVSPLKAFPTVSLVLHMNGTYRARWDERLGFCRGVCTPLAFRCIKDDGGVVPCTIVGITRIYPVLYKERLRSGASVVRSERWEASCAQLHNQRCSDIIEGITSDFQRGSIGSCIENDYDDEGAKILKMLESVAEPELLMADMSPEQLTSFSKYQAKVEEKRQENLQRLIVKALEDEGLNARNVTQFMRVRVVGLQSKGQCKGEVLRNGLITIWNPTEWQRLELVEGEAYAISGLTPLHSDSNTLYLQNRGWNNKWKKLTRKDRELFGPFFDPPKPVLLSKIGEVSSDFDTAVLVLHVGLEFLSGQHKKQWVFVTDGSVYKLQTEESTVSLMAIIFSTQCTDDCISPINSNLVGSIVGFRNLTKRDKDHGNHMWVAEATENSTYYLNCDHPSCSHLKDSFYRVKRWEQRASLTIEKLKKKVLDIIGGPAPEG